MESKQLINQAENNTTARHMAAPGLSRLHSLDISNGKVCGMVRAAQDVSLCGSRLERRTRQLCTRGSSCQYLPAGQPAGTGPGARDEPVRIVSGNVQIDREMPLPGCDKARLHPRSVFVIWCLCPILSVFEEPKTTFAGKGDGFLQSWRLLCGYLDESKGDSRPGACHTTG